MNRRHDPMLSKLHKRSNYDSDSVSSKGSSEGGHDTENESQEPSSDDMFATDNGNDATATIKGQQAVEPVDDLSPTDYPKCDYNNKFEPNVNDTIRWTSFKDQDESSNDSEAESDDINDADTESEAWTLITPQQVDVFHGAQKLRLEKEGSGIRRSGLSVNQPKSGKEALEKLINMLEPAESPMEALARLAPRKVRPGNKAHPDDPDAIMRKNAAFELTGLCNFLVSYWGLADSYDMSREELLRHYSRKTGHELLVNRGVKRTLDDADNIVDSDTIEQKNWEFHWIGDEEVYGPFSSFEMKHWKDTYFESKVEVRKIGEKSFKHVEHVLFE